jgi:hypothetical protein
MLSATRVNGVKNKKLLESLKAESRSKVGEWVGGNIYELDPDKLAKAIVEECIAVIGENNYNMLTGVAYCDSIKRHFGLN